MLTQSTRRSKGRRSSNVGHEVIAGRVSLLIQEADQWRPPECRAERSIRTVCTTFYGFVSRLAPREVADRGHETPAQRAVAPPPHFHHV